MFPKRVRRVLLISPMSIGCPYCHAKGGQGCAIARGGFAVLHVARIEAAAAQDTSKKKSSAHDETELRKKVKRLLEESQRIQKVTKTLKQQTEKLRHSFKRLQDETK